MNEITIFNNPQFGEVRVTATENGEPMFCLADVARVLELTPSKVAQRLSEDVLSKYPLETAGGSQMANFINEDGLYDAVLDSRKPEAKKFRKWVTSEVLPSIRKHGAYATPITIESIIANPENGIKLLTALKEERDARLLAEKKAYLEAEINKTNAPKVLFADAVSGSKSSCLIGELAKIITQNGYKIGQNRLFEWLRENGYLGTKGECRNVPNQRYQEMGLFTVKKGVRSGNDGVMHTTLTTKVTGKGQQYFINKFLAEDKAANGNLDNFNQ